MKSPWKVLSAGAILLVLMSAVHTHMLPVAIDWDGSNAMFIIGVMSFILSCLLPLAPSKIRLFLRIVLLPILFSVSFSFFELSGELNPNVVSKGWGIIYVVACLPASFIGTAAGLLVGWFMRKARNSTANHG